MMMKNRIWLGLFSLAVITFGFVTQGRAETIYGMAQGNLVATSRGRDLVRFDSASPGTITYIGPFTGVIPNQSIRSIDFRPATGQLYAISTDVDNANLAQLYTVNLATAVLTPVGIGFSLGTGPTANASPIVEIEFNPLVDRIRIVTGATGASNQSNNFRADPNTGQLVSTDTHLIYDAMDNGNNPGFNGNGIAAAAYSNNRFGGTQTTLFAYDYLGFDTLVTIGGPNGSPSPNGGSIFTVAVGPFTGSTTNGSIGMDISGATNICYVTHDNPSSTPQPGTISSLFTKDLTTGVETKVADYGSITPIIGQAGPALIGDISVQTPTTAAGVTISGRLLTTAGRGIINARVSLTDQQGGIRYATTTKGGNYKFDDVEVGSTYIVSVVSRQFRFENSTRILTLTDAVGDLDFVGISTLRQVRDN